MNKELMFSSKTNEWSTPQEFYDNLNKEFNFTLDPCCTEENHKCEKYYTEVENGLIQSWKDEIVFCNPPYSLPEHPCKKDCKKKKCKEREYHIDKYIPGQVDWIKKAYREHREHGITIVMLLPARTDTEMFHEYIYHQAEIKFIKGRLKFGGCKDGAPFPSMVVIFKQEKG